MLAKLSTIILSHLNKKGSTAVDGWCSVLLCFVFWVFFPHVRFVQCFHLAWNLILFWLFRYKKWNLDVWLVGFISGKVCREEIPKLLWFWFRKRHHYLQVLEDSVHSCGDLIFQKAWQNWLSFVVLFEVVNLMSPTSIKCIVARGRCTGRSAAASWP